MTELSSKPSNGLIRHLPFEPLIIRPEIRRTHPISLSFTRNTSRCILFFIRVFLHPRRRHQPFSIGKRKVLVKQIVLHSNQRIKHAHMSWDRLRQLEREILKVQMIDLSICLAVPLCYNPFAIICPQCSQGSLLYWGIQRRIPRGLLCST